MVRALIAGAALVVGLYPLQAAAQSSAEVTLFSKGHYKGARTALAGTTRFSQPLIVRSIVVPEGSEWELCSGRSHTGCRRVSGSSPAMIMTVRSARPVPTILVANNAAPATATGRGASLRGLASEFFVAPDDGGSRLAVAPATAEAMARRANDFCRARGWRSSAHGRLQTVGERVYLADVLCIDQ